MKPAPIPDNEDARMADVQAANILNTPREEHGLELRGGREIATALRISPR